jgi:hypothetical protein
MYTVEKEAQKFWLLLQFKKTVQRKKNRPICMYVDEKWPNRRKVAKYVDEKWPNLVTRYTRNVQIWSFKNLPIKMSLFT